MTTQVRLLTPEAAAATYEKVFRLTGVATDGSASVSAALQALIDYVASIGGGTVLVDTPGTYKLTMRYMAGYTDLMAAIWLRSNVHLRCVPGVKFKLEDNAPLLTGVTLANQRAHVISTIDPYNTVSTSNIKKNIRITGLELDCNGQNQTAQTLYAGIFLGLVDGAWLTDCNVYGLYGTLPGPPGETMHYELRSCRNVHYTNCDADGQSVPTNTATGFSANFSHDITYTSCTAHDLAQGQGFTVWQCSGVRYPGSYAYRVPNAAGFNCERSTDINYSGSAAGGLSPTTSGDRALPTSWYAADSTSLGCYWGYRVLGGVGVVGLGVNSTHNQYGIYVDSNAAIAPTINSDGVIFSGDLSSNPSGNFVSTSGGAVRTWLGPYKQIDGFAADQYHVANAPHELYTAANAGSGLKTTVRGVGTYVWRLFGEAAEIVRVKGGFGVNTGGDSNTTDRPGDVQFFYNVSAATVGTGVISGAGKLVVADTDFAHQPGDGAIAYAVDTSTGVIRECVRQSGSWSVMSTSRPSRSLADVRADASAVNSTTETTLAALAVPTTVASGDILRLIVMGDLLNNSGGSVGYTFRLKVGATTVLTGKATTATSANRVGLRVDGECLVLTPASSQRVGALIAIGAGSAVNNWQIGGTVGTGTGTAAEDLTAGKNLTLTVQMDVASASADCFLHAATLEILKR